MILSKTVKTQISNQGKYYESIGYGNLKQGMLVDIKIEHLLPNCNKKVLCKCDDCETNFERQYQLIARVEIHRCYGCTRKYIGKNIDQTKAIVKNKLRTCENHPRWRKNKPEFQAYAYKVRRLTETTYKENIKIINPDNLPRTLCGIKNGYQLDHKVSIKFGFENKIPPEELAKLDNLQMLSWKRNREKW